MTLMPRNLTMTAIPPARRLLNKWAVNRAGYASFDLYLMAGGSFLAARDELLREAAEIDVILAYIANFHRPVKAPDPEPEPSHHAAIGPDALARLEAEHSDDEPADTDNAQVQGAEHHG